MVRLLVRSRGVIVQERDSAARGIEGVHGYGGISEVSGKELCVVWF